MRCFVMLLLSLPLATIANANYMLSTPETLVPVVLGAVLGGIAALAIPTDVDASLKHPNFTKLVVGTALGVICPLTWEAFDPMMTANKLALPAFVIALFGTPIAVFLVTLICEPLAWKIALFFLLKRLGFDVDVDPLFQRLEEKRATQFRNSVNSASPRVDAPEQSGTDGEAS